MLEKFFPSSLPLDPEDDLQQLIVALETKIDPDGCSKKAKLAAASAQAACRLAKEKYLRAGCVQMILTTLMLEHRSGKAGLASTSQQLHLLQQVQRAQGVHAVLAHVQRSPLAGIHYMDVAAAAASDARALKAAVQVQLMPLLATAAMQSCTNILAFIDTVPTQQKMIDAKLRTLHSEAAAKCSRVTSDEIELECARRASLLCSLEYVRVLLALAHVLYHAVAELKVKRAPKAFAALSAYAMQRSRALNFKLSVTKSEVRTELYTPANVAALNRIRARLQASLEQAKTTLHRSEAQLRSYRDMGTGFDELVEEYTRLVERLEDRQWTMKEVQAASTQ